MALDSPGVEVTVIDESFYSPAAAGSVPMIFIATASNKESATGSGTAEGTLPQNAGRPYLVTSQRELGELFGDAVFYSDENNNMLHGNELNEYGLQAAHSSLGVINRAYVVRADLDLSKLEAQAEEPQGEPADGAHWLDTRTTSFGLLEWDSRPVISGGQSFSSVEMTVINRGTKLKDPANGDYTPRSSVGTIGDYAVVTYADSNRVWHKTNGRATVEQNGILVNPGDWVEVGKPAWRAANPTVRGTSSVNVTSSGSVTINSETITLDSGDSGSDVADKITTALFDDGISAAYAAGSLEIYSTGDDVEISGDQSDLDALGLDDGTFGAPRVTIDPHTRVPRYRRNDPNPAPSGSLWLKTTTPNGGAAFNVLVYNSDTGLWDDLEADMFKTPAAALFNLDRTGGGIDIPKGDIYVKANDAELEYPLVNYRIYTRADEGRTEMTTVSISDDFDDSSFTSGPVTFELSESIVAEAEMSDFHVVEVELTGTEDDAEEIASSINGAGFSGIGAEVTDDNKVVVYHRDGGEIRIKDTDGIFTASADFDDENLFDAPSGSDADYAVSLWHPLTYTASDSAPFSQTEDGTIWYNSVIDEVDIMVHDGEKWVGYRNMYPDTREEGPFVGASEPEDAVANDLWIDTSDIDAYPQIRRFDPDSGWVLVDNSDQTTDQGILFDDARWSTAGSRSTAASIEELATSDYVDPDAPDPALYPRDMLLWNMRRSGFNVKRYVRNYIDIRQDNSRFDDEPMSDYHPHRWVTDSGNNEDGSGTFGRLAQRKSVTQSLQRLLNSSDAIRDDESRQFNIMCCPGYPELIGEMVTLNFDRKLSAFVIGDTPARLTPDATSLNEWATNVRGAVEDNDDGAVTFDEYTAMYYSWGFTSDNLGNNVVVPPSHMALRTMLLSDQVAYPWYAAAGTRRGGVTNATSSGYITDEGQFETVALNEGQRDTLYLNNINPITFISGSGLLLYGQKTRAREASALDRINVARLVVYMRGQLDQIVRPYLFEPNDKITRDQVKASVESFLLELVGLRAVDDFLVVCDESNNTPARIDRNELWCDVIFSPVRAVEFIYVPVRIRGTGDVE